MKNMKRPTTFFLIFILTLASVNAAEDSGTSWAASLARVFDQTRLSLTFNPESKARIGMQIADSQLTEMNQGMINGDFTGAEKTLNNYLETIGTVEENIEKISDRNLQRELEIGIELKKQTLEQQLNIIQWLGDEDLNSQDREKRKILLEAARNKNDELHNLISVKQKNTIIKLKAVEKKDEETLAREIENMETGAGIKELETSLVNRRTITDIMDLEYKKDTDELNKINSSDYDASLRILKQIENKER